jgi:hypothetical protein
MHESCPTTALLSPVDMDLGGGGPTSIRSHHLQFGRPCIDSLLLSAVEGLETKHLVVAACGPPALVETVRKAVVAAKMEHPGISFEFRGSNPHW